VSDADVGFALVPAIHLPFIIFAGLLINLASTPVYFVWIPYINFMRWAFQGLANNEVHNEEKCN
jgi:hypothetical protein